jgi:hypothetical protein
MSNLYTMRVIAKGCDADLAVLKSDMLRHCNAIKPKAPATAPVEYSVDLATWNPNRRDWVREPVQWWCLELRKGHSELISVKDGEFRAHVVGRGAPLHFLDGLRELYPRLELSAYLIDLDNGFGEQWRCSAEGTFCVEKVMSCWEGEQVWYWHKDGRLMIDDGKPAAEELLEFAGMPFVMVDGVPLSISRDAAKEHVQKQVREGRTELAVLLDGRSLGDGPGELGDADARVADFFRTLERMRDEAAKARTSNQVKDGK